MLDALRFWILWQASLTLFFVLILVILRAYRSRAFFDYWIVAWSCYCLALFLSALALGANASPAKWGAIAASLLLSFAQVWALFMAALSLHGRPARRHRHFVLLVCLATALVVLALSFALQAWPSLSFAIRGAGRSLALAAAFFYTASAIRRWRAWASPVAVQVIVTGCAAYAAIKLVELAVLVYVAFGSTPSPSLQHILALDAFCEFVIVAGMCRLLLEESASFRARLELYESILPVCCVCGVVRDDSLGGRGRGQWMTIYEFVARYSPLRFSHGYCPKCFPLYFPERRTPVPAGPAEPATAGMAKN